MMLSAAAAPSPPLKWQIAGEFSCPTRADVERALSEGLGPPNATAALTLVVTSRGAGHFAIELRGSSTPLARDLLVDDSECGQLPQTIALLAQTWLRQGLVALEPTRPSKTPRPHPARASRDDTGPIDAGMDVSTSEVAATPPEEPPDSEPAPDAVAEPLPILAAPPPEASVQTAAPRSASAVQLLAWGGASVTPTGLPAASGGLRVSWSPTHSWFIGLQASIDSQREVSLSPGSVVFTSEALTLLGGLRLHGFERGGLDVVLGVGAERVAARTYGYSADSAATLYDAGGWLSLEWLQPVTTHIRLVAGAGLSARARTESFEISGLAAVIRYLPVSLRAHIGGGWDFF
jgi:hypothetical protein